MTSSEWGTNTYAISQHDNAGQYAIALNGEDTYNPGLWSRFDWTMDEAGEMYYCQIAYDAATEADALAAVDADATDLDAGCSDFSWTMMSAGVEL